MLDNLMVWFTRHRIAVVSAVLMIVAMQASPTLPLLQGLFQHHGLISTPVPMSDLLRTYLTVHHQPGLAQAMLPGLLAILAICTSYLMAASWACKRAAQWLLAQWDRRQPHSASSISPVE